MKKQLLLLCLSAGLLLTTGLVAADTLQLASVGLETGAGRGTTDTWQALNPRKLKLKSAAALVMDRQGNELYAKKVDTPMPIASITKLMTAMVILDAKLPLNEKITIDRDDRDLIRLTGSRLQYGATLTRKELLQLMLLASENRAANALARTWPGGADNLVRTMNSKADTLNMHASHFTDPAGLDAGNVATARDLVKLVRAARQYPLIHAATTTRALSVKPYKGRGKVNYVNTNRLLRSDAWDIQLSKTGYINEAGRCLTMQTEIADQPLTIVLLNSFGKLTPVGDSNRIRKWIQAGIDD